MVVIGKGKGGYVEEIKDEKIGIKVEVVEKRKKLGGK